MSSNYLDLNKKNIRESVVDKLKALGYEVNYDTPIMKVKDIIILIQRDNGLMVDGYIGERTAPLLGYSWEEIKKMLKIRNFRSDSSYKYPLWLLWC